MKQRDIHEKRDARKHRIVMLNSEIAMNEHILPSFTSYIAAAESEGHSYIDSQLAELRASKDDSRPPNSTGPSYREMMVSLLEQLKEETDKQRDASAKKSVLAGEAIDCRRAVDRTRALHSSSSATLLQLQRRGPTGRGLERRQRRQMHKTRMMRRSKSLSHRLREPRWSSRRSAKAFA